MCTTCGNPNCPSTCPTCTNTGCIIKLDTSCIIYHKNDNKLSELSELDIENGATLEAILEEISDRFIPLRRYLDNQTSDPTADNGDYWFRTDLDELHMKLNGVVRVITIT